jgi:septal ring factor EnvC (AmiA/AmiB activator)
MQRPIVRSPAMLVHEHRALRWEVMALGWMLVALLAAARAPRGESEDALPTPPVELMAMQEEVDVAQEELQAMQEELAVTQEELYATHEELRATTAEWEATMADLAMLNGELQRQLDKDACHARATNAGARRPNAAADDSHSF